ncbi:neuropeptide-like protein C4orf48 homolog isoform X1 [Felis catus]|uniref:neuropeptide-like protein C4orf48 homolog isoform X1 n=1 Tax=Felis catus TaxID=9685 RepID=UPI001D1A248A|nr:neuropeptide-like protein C4orf48 homolog isoform X1 [Felis catus]
MRTSGNAARSPPAPEPQTGSPARRPPDGEEERVAVTSTGPSPGSGSPRPAGATADPRPGGGGGGRAGSGRRPGAAPNSVSRWALWHSRGRDVDLGRLPRRCWALEAASRRQVEPILPRGNSSARRGPEARAHRAPTRGGQARFFTSNNPALPRGRKGHREAKLPLRGRPRLPALGHGPPASVQAPEVAAAVAAAAAVECGAAGLPGPSRARRWERRPRAEPPVRGLPRVRVHAARPAGSSEDGLQPGLEGPEDPESPRV